MLSFIISVAIAVGFAIIVAVVWKNGTTRTLLAKHELNTHTTITLRNSYRVTKNQEMENLDRGAVETAAGFGL